MVSFAELDSAELSAAKFECESLGFQSLEVLDFGFCRGLQFLRADSRRCDVHLAHPFDFGSRSEPEWA